MVDNRDMKWRKRGHEILTNVLSYRANNDKNSAWNTFVDLSFHLGFNQMLKSNFTEDEFNKLVDE